MAREKFVHEGLVCVQQIENSAIVAYNVCKEEFGFPAEGLAYIIIEIREHQKIGRDLIQIAQLKPLSGKSRHQAVRSLVSNHAPHLCPEHSRLMQPAGDGEIQEFVIRNTAPEEERQP